MDFYRVVNARYSIRHFSSRPVLEEAMRRILDAARLAPSAANRQPWHFYVVRDTETRHALFPDERQASVAAAPVIIVACSYPDRAWVRPYDGKNHADIDIAIAMEHLILAATQEGLATCWLCAFDPKHIRKVLDLPPDMEPVAATPLGYAAAEPRPRSRKELDQIITWW